jgi:hypothetical protein
MTFSVTDLFSFLGEISRANYLRDRKNDDKGQPHVYADRKGAANSNATASLGRTRQLFCLQIKPPPAPPFFKASTQLLFLSKALLGCP